MSEVEKEIVIAFAKCNMNLSETARMVHMHRNSVIYNFEKIFKKTGLKPQRFLDLVKLVKMALRKVKGGEG